MCMLIFCNFSNNLILFQKQKMKNSVRKKKERKKNVWQKLNDKNRLKKKRKKQNERQLPVYWIVCNKERSRVKK